MRAVILHIIDQTCLNKMLKLAKLGNVMWLFGIRPITFFPQAFWVKTIWGEKMRLEKLPLRSAEKPKKKSKGKPGSSKLWEAEFDQSESSKNVLGCCFRIGFYLGLFLCSLKILYFYNFSTLVPAALGNVEFLNINFNI